MTWFKEARKPSENDVVFTVRVTEAFAPEFEKLLDDLKKTSNMGHSFNVTVDSEYGKGRDYFVDGDGSDQITEFSKSTEKKAIILDFPNYNRDDQMAGNSGDFNPNAPVDRKKKIAPDPGPASLNPGGADIAPQIFE